MNEDLWIPIDDDAKDGRKLLLVGKSLDICAGAWSAEDGYFMEGDYRSQGGSKILLRGTTHYQELPEPPMHQECPDCGETEGGHGEFSVAFQACGNCSWPHANTRPQPLGKNKKASLIERGFFNGDPYGTRTRVSAVKGQRPRPLDEGTVIKSGC